MWSEEVIGPPVIYQHDDVDKVVVMLGCGHHLVIRKDSPIWIEPSIPLWCEPCGQESMLHPLVLLEFGFWQDAQQT